MMAWWVALTAFAADSDAALSRLEFGEAVEGQADTDGSSRIRTRTDLAARFDLDEGWELTAAGALRLDPLDPGKAHAPPSAADLYRFAIEGGGAGWSLAMGRVLRSGPLGRSRLDGFVLDGGRDRDLTAWAGRISHPEPVDGPTVLGAGLDLRWRPSSRLATVSGLVGYELRGATDAAFVTHRVHAAASTEGPRGGTLDGRVTLGARTGEDPLTGARGAVRAEAPVGRTRVHAGLRWEGFPQDDVPETSLGVEAAIAPGPYGVADLGAWTRTGPVQVRLSGGPTVVVGSETLSPRLGGVGRITADVGAEDVHAGAFTAAASIGGSWYAGGGLVGGVRYGRIDLSADGGVFRFDGLAGDGVVAEGRLWGEAVLGTPERGARVGVFGATGADRLRAAYTRGGISLRGWFG